MDLRRARGSSSALLTKICPRRILTWPLRFTKETLGSFPFSNLRTGREQHVPDSSNHWLYLIKSFNSSYPEGHCGGNQPPDGSICPSPPKPKFHERFARPSTMVSCFFDTFLKYIYIYTVTNAIADRSEGALFFIFHFSFFNFFHYYFLFFHVFDFFFMFFLPGVPLGSPRPPPKHRFLLRKS